MAEISFNTDIYFGQNPKCCRHIIWALTYTDHNSSNTISVRPDEWDKCEEIVWENWEDFIGVSFIAYDGGTYELAPYEEISEEEYEELKSKVQPFNPNLIELYEHSETEADLENMNECAMGACPIR